MNAPRRMTPAEQHELKMLITQVHSIKVWAGFNDNDPFCPPEQRAKKRAPLSSRGTFNGAVPNCIAEVQS